MSVMQEIIADYPFSHKLELEDEDITLFEDEFIEYFINKKMDDDWQHELAIKFLYYIGDQGVDRAGSLFTKIFGSLGELLDKEFYYTPVLVDNKEFTVTEQMKNLF